jgi:hypothetical protein
MTSILPSLTSIFKINGGICRSVSMHSMKNRHQSALLLSVLALLCFSQNTYGASAQGQNLFFNAKLGIVDANTIDLFLIESKRERLEKFDVATPDLNTDGIPEFVLKPKNCPAGPAGCTYVILAENKTSMVLLGEIKARKLLLGNAFTHGIQDFLAFNNDNNDYEYVRYVWSPVDAAYIVEQID